MPDSSGRLTQEDQDAVQQWLATNWHRNQRCPISGHNNWFTAEHIVQPTATTGGSVVLGGTGYPQVMVICQGCGYTMYFNAVVIGLLPGGGS